MNNSPGSPDIRSFFKKSNRDPLYELQPDSELLLSTDVQSEKKTTKKMNANKPCPPKRRKINLSENVPCPASKKPKTESISPLVSPQKDMSLKTVFTAQDLLESTDDEEIAFNSKSESSPEESLGPREFSDESSLDESDVDTSDNVSIENNQKTSVRNFNTKCLDNRPK